MNALNTIKILRPVTLTALLFGLTSQALGGGVSGGGGNLAKQQPVTASEVESTLRRYKDVFPLVMNQFAMNFVKDGFRGHRDVPPNSPFAFMLEKFGDLKTSAEISRKAQTAQLTFQSYGCAYKNPRGQWEKSQASTQGYYLATGTVVEIQDPMVCFDSTAIAPLVSKSSLVKELGALFGHEISHQIGFDEREAQIFQDYLLNSLASLPYLPTPSSDFEYLAQRLERRILGLEKLKAFAMAGPNPGAFSMAAAVEMSTLMDFVNQLTPNHLRGLELLDLPASRTILAAAMKSLLLLLATPQQLRPGLDMHSDTLFGDLVQAFEGRPQIGFNQFVENLYELEARREKQDARWIPLLFRDDVVVRNVSDQNWKNIVLEINDCLQLLREVKQSVDKKTKQVPR